MHWQVFYTPENEVELYKRTLESCFLEIAILQLFVLVCIVLPSASVSFYIGYTL